MTRGRKLVTGGLLSAAVLFFLGARGPTISGEEARALVKQGALLLDVRTPAEFAAGHVEGAVNLPLATLGDARAALPANQDEPIVVYCQSGRRSAAAKRALEEAGFTRVSDLGAMSNWKEPASPRDDEQTPGP